MAGISRRPRSSPPICQMIWPQSLALARTQLTEQARPGRFGPAQIVAEQAPANERLVAFLGRPVSTEG